MLDVEDHIRKERIASREASGEADNFDRYMAANSELSEQTEDTLIWVTTTHLNGQLIPNNDTPEGELRRQIVERV